MTKQRFKGGYTDGVQDFYVLFVVSDAPINIGILVNLESHDSEQDFSAHEVIEAALVEAALVGLEGHCRESDEVSIDNVVLKDYVVAA